MQTDILIIGAGILGVTTAYHLARLGAGRITVIDQFALGAGASGRSGALIRSNYENEAEARLAVYSKSIFADFANLVGGRSGFAPVGMLEVLPADHTSSTATLAQKQKDWGVKIRAITSDDAKELCPLMRLEDDAAILFEESAGYCNPNSVLRSYFDQSRALGVNYEFGVHARRLVIRRGKILGVSTSQGSVSADSVIVAAGAWADRLFQLEGINFNLMPRLSRVSVFRPYEFEESSDMPIVMDRVQEAWFRPFESGQILVGAERGGTLDVNPDMIPDVSPNSVVDSYKSILAYRFKVSQHASPRGSWAGAYMLSPDMRPLVGAVPRINGLFFAGADSGGAFKIAPAIGLGLAEIILTGSARSVDLGPLALTRLRHLYAERDNSHSDLRPLGWNEAPINVANLRK
jgi:sarcosine oxidase subunit beta